MKRSVLLKETIKKLINEISDEPMHPGDGSGETFDPGLPETFDELLHRMRLVAARHKTIQPDEFQEFVDGLEKLTKKHHLIY